MKPAIATSAARSAEFVRFIAETYKDDPEGYFADILGTPGDKWQCEVARSVRDNKRTAVSSGHGIGKTREGAMIVHWFISTRPNPAIVCTANTEDQLTKKLWRELAKVNNGARNRDWFDWKARTFTMFEDPTAQAVALSWSEHNPEAFAGTHEQHVLGLFDESSAIARVIFNVFQGAMTTSGARWLLLGNPTRNEGYFYDCTHGKLVARRPGDLGDGLWKSFVIPSWESKFVDPQWVEQMRTQYGEESDEFRVRVAGLPPRYDAEQFIAREHVAAAMERKVKMFDRWPLVLGIDVGHVNDRSTIVPRRGRIVPDRIKIIKGERTTDFARRIVEEILYYREFEGLDANCVIEEIGMGVGVVETIEDMGYSDRVWGINTGARAYEDELFLNLRCEMWANLKEWLEGDVQLPNNPDLNDDLCSIKRKASGSTNKLKLESKEEMRRRGLKSPDIGDGLALSFAVQFDLLPERHNDLWNSNENSGSGPGTWAGM